MVAALGWCRGALQAEIDALLAQRQFQSAFSLALSCGDLLPVVNVCKALDPEDSVFPPDSQSLLDCSVLLSLIQHLAFDLTSDADVKAIWLKEALLALDPLDPLIATHVEVVLLEVAGRVDACLLHQPQDAKVIAVVDRLPACVRVYVWCVCCVDRHRVSTTSEPSRNC